MAYFIQPLPGNDILGDAWSKKVQKAWDRMMELDRDLTAKPHAYHLWQWSMCQMAGMNHRVVASPNACLHAAQVLGDPLPDSQLIPTLLKLSDKVLLEMFSPPTQETH